MITRPIKGRGFRGVLNYLATPEYARLLGGNMQGKNPRELAHEFSFVRRQRPGVRRAVAHMFLRPAPGEFLTDAQWRNVASYFLAGMGFDASPHVLYLHAEPHPHIHIVASRITYDGKVVSDSNDYAKADVLLRNIERQYGLRVVPTDSELAAPSRGDFGRSRRTGTPPRKTRLQEILASASFPLTLREYLDHLHRHGVAMLPNIARTGHVSGISYVFEGQAMKASDVGRQHTWASLVQRLTPAPDDLSLLAVERARAQSALALADSTPAAPPDAVAALPSATALSDLRQSLSGPDRTLFERLASIEESLLSATPAEFVERALAYGAEAARAERLLVASLDPGKPHSQPVESMARALAADPGPPPTPRVVEHFLRTDEVAHDLLRDRLARTLRAGTSPAAADGDLRQAIERTLDSRRALLVLELRAVAWLHDAAHRSREERAPLLRETTILQTRLESARIDRELGLRLLPEEAGDRSASRSAPIGHLRDRLDELRQELLQLAASPVRQEGPVGIPWQPAPPTGRAIEIATERLDAIRDATAQARAQEGNLSSADTFKERLLAYFQASDSARALALDSLHPTAALYRHDPHILAGQEIVRRTLETPYRRRLSYTDVDLLRGNAQNGLLYGLLDTDRPSGIGYLIYHQEDLNRIAIQSAVALYELRSRASPNPAREAELLLVEKSVELHSQNLQQVLLADLARENPRAYRYELLQVAEHHYDLGLAVRQQRALVPEADEAAARQDPLTPSEHRFLAAPDLAAADKATEILAGLRSTEAQLAKAPPEEFRERLFQYLEKRDVLRDDALRSLRLRETSRNFDDNPRGLADLNLVRSLLSEAPRPDMTLTYVEDLGREAAAARATLLQGGAPPDALASFLESRQELERVTFYAQLGLAELPPFPSRTLEQNREQSYLRLLQEKVALYALDDQVQVLAGLPDRRDAYDYAEYRLDALESEVYAYRTLPRPVRVAHIEPQDPFWDPDPVEPREAAALAESFRADSRFSPEPAFFLPPTREELPGLAAEAHQAFGRLEEATDHLALATTDTYDGLALAQASQAALVENLDQRFATFGADPVPRGLSEEGLLAYLETRLQLHEIRHGVPSPDVEGQVGSLLARLAELRPDPALRDRSPHPLRDHREAYARVEEILAAPASVSRAEFRRAVSHALDRHARVGELSASLEARLHAQRAEHVLLSSRLESPDSPDAGSLRALEQEIRRAESRYREARIAIADRDLHLLERHLGAHPSSEALDRYTELLRDRESIARLRGSRAEDGLAPSRRPDLAAARQAVLEDPSSGHLRGYREAVRASLAAAHRTSMAATVEALGLRRGELAQALKEVAPGQSSSLQARRALRAAASRYVETLHEVADYAPRPPRRGTLLDYAAHAESSALSPASLDRLRQSALTELRATSTPAPAKPGAIPADPPASRASEALRLAVHRLERRENALRQSLSRIRAGSHGPQPTRRALQHLVASIDGYRQALSSVERLARPTLVSPLEFLRHPSFRHRPLHAVADWTLHAARQGLKPSQVRSALRSFGLPLVAGTAARAARNLASRFFQDQVHER